MSDRETAIRAALDLYRQRYRVLSVPAYDDEAAAGIRAVLGQPSGMVTADGPDAARAIAVTAECAEQMGRLRGLAGEMLESFKQGPNGWSARVKAEQVQEWRERLGEQE
jgi:hypothetical protein